MRFIYPGFSGNEVKWRKYSNVIMVTFIDVVNPLPEGPITEIYFYADPTKDSVYVRLQIWRRQGDFSFQLIWEYRQFLYVTGGGALYQVQYVFSFLLHAMYIPSSKFIRS